MTVRIVIIGAGISGLAAAWAARRAAAARGERPDIVVLERDPAVGGKAVTLREDPWLLEGGPTGFLDNEPRLRELIAEVGLDDELVPADAAAARRFLVRGGKLREVKPSPLALATSGILSPPGFLRLATEPLRAKRTSTEDESVWDFARRRLGREAADRMIAPMVLGVFAGDAKQLSLAAAFPKLAALEADHGSLVRGMIAKRRERGRSAGGGKAGGPAGPGGQLTSFRRGMQTLPERLMQRKDFQVWLGAEALAVIPGESTRWRVTVAGEPEAIPCDHVVFAGEPWAMAPLLESSVPAAAELLAGIHCPPVTVLGLGYTRSQAPHVPVGFGALIPRTEGLHTLGVLWDSHLFPGRSPDGTLLVRAMTGGSVDPETAALPDDELCALVQSELATLLRIQGAPQFTRIVRWPRAIPQYELGHLQRMQSTEKHLASAPGLHLAGNAIAGVAFGRAAVRGLEIGERIANYSAPASATS